VIQPLGYVVTYDRASHSISIGVRLVVGIDALLDWLDATIKEVKRAGRS